MHTPPKISIIIPVYNVEPYIAECLQSVMRQTYTGKMECIIVDDCGTDKSVDIARRLISRYTGPIAFRILHHDHNRGLSAARNTGTEAANGEYIYYLDSDDYVSDDCIEVLSQPLLEREYDMVVGDYELFGDRQNQISLVEQRTEILGNDFIFESYVDRKIYVMACNKLCRFSFLKDNNISFLEGQLHEDELWSYKTMQHIQSISLVHKISYHYRIRANSITNNTSSISRKCEGFYNTLMFIETHKHSNYLAYEKCLNFYWAYYLRLVFDGNLDYKQQYCTLRKVYPLNIWSIFFHRKISLNYLKNYLHYALPPRMGYLYLNLWIALKKMKNKHSLCGHYR